MIAVVYPSKTSVEALAQLIVCLSAQSLSWILRVQSDDRYGFLAITVIPWRNARDWLFAVLFMPINLHTYVARRPDVAMGEHIPLRNESYRLQPASGSILFMQFFTA